MESGNIKIVDAEVEGFLAHFYLTLISYTGKDEACWKDKCGSTTREIV